MSYCDDSSLPPSQGSARSITSSTNNSTDSHRTLLADSSQDSQGDEADPLLSVLNIVIDYSMAPPSPLEKEEFREFMHPSSAKKNRANVQVPVLRVFGPIVRGGYNRPHQSACLYIHNAFPYMLARPVVAGPDGSLHRSSHRDMGNLVGQQVDWDDAESVQTIVQNLKTALEDAIQASMMVRMGEDGTSAEQRNSRSGKRVIRRMSVVVGRGFYTYCPGPAAPFLKIEYYDPKLRWKVKFVLERGLDVPRSYHPDLQQYQATLTPPTSAEEHDEALKFHCYEAHIPYTMQFFKDYNLAGMAYIHASKGQFRGLPRAHHRSVVENEDEIFLQHNTDSQHVWSNDISDSQDASFLQQSSSASADETCAASVQEYRPVDPTAWTRRATSCDVEVDVSVEHILNIRDIISGLSAEEEEPETSIHWRTVPSLKEVWLQERRRMKQLLKPQEDFLSLAVKSKPQQQPPSLTLDVKKNASTSGAMMAVLGMRRLLSVSHGLADEFHRTMRQIVQRHLASVLRIDDSLRQRPRGGRPRRLQLSPVEEEMQEKEDLEALEALGALGGQFEETEPGDEMNLSQDSSGSDGGVYAELFSQRTASPTSSQGSGQEDERTEEILSQRVDRGESVLETVYNHTEEFLNPETLTPCDESDDDEKNEDEGMSERDFERTLTILSSTEAISRSQSTLPSSRPNSLEILSPDSTSTNDLATEAVHASTATFPRQQSTTTSFGWEDMEDDDEVSCGDQTVLDFNENDSRLTNSPQRIRHNDSVLPPTRGDFRADGDGLRVTLLPLERRGCQSWLPHVSAYERIRREYLMEHETMAPAADTTPQRMILAPTIGPPSQEKVRKWCQKQATANGEKEKYSREDDLQIDDNSRKLVAVPKQKRRKLEGAAVTNGVTEVEEVDWDEPMSQSQPDCSQPEGVRQNVGGNQTEHRRLTESQSSGQSEARQQALDGIGQQGGRIHIEGGGGLKAKTRTTQTQLQESQDRVSLGDLPTPLTVMTIEVHVQCRSGRAGVNDSKEIAMRPNFEKDKISSVVFVSAVDPGGGKPIEVVERACLFVPVEAEKINHSDREAYSTMSTRMTASLPRHSFGIVSPMLVECLPGERQLLLRLASIVRRRDPDMLLSWDPQGAGIGYIIERGQAMGNSPESGSEIDMSRLLGRTPTARKDREKTLYVELGKLETDGGKADLTKEGPKWTGSGLGADWDERVGAGAAAASVVGRIVFSGWKLVAEEVKHPNASYLPAIVSTILNRRIPFHDDLVLSQWYGLGRERWRVLHHRLEQAMACLQIFDKLDIIGRAGEAARLSGVEFSQSFPGIRGSQYKVEGVLLRALKSVHSDDRGSRRGRNKTVMPTNNQCTAIDSASSLSNESKKSQTQSPWKVRRGLIDMEAEETTTASDVNKRCYFFYSPSVQDTARQEALECQALTLEPQSGHDEDPVVVCDFTALYPSLVIAYNLCYSTCAGRLSYHTTRREMRQQGRTTGRLGPFLYPESRTATVLHHHIKSLNRKDASDDPGTDAPEKERLGSDRAYATPTGTIYVSESVLKGVLPQVLDELLSTRAMLKKAAKLYKKHVPDLSPSVLRQLEARQLALKYVANVTYGYTSATFSGRCAMPLLADSIVECARRTLTNAINLANRWGSDPQGRWFRAEVIYGDTDSVFVRLPGRSVSEAFDFGEHFCKAVTSTNPPPVQLKLEKVYHGSIMQTKKKYCGMKFESRDQKKPVFEAKGIETIRRDQCALTQKILRNVLVTLFRTADLEAVKAYLFRQWSLILAGQLPVSDFILTGRVRSKYRGGRVGPVQAVLARRLAEADPGRIVRHKERLAYVIVATPGLTFRLRDCVLTPTELLEQWDAFTIHAGYYITKHVNAAVQRCLGLAPHHVNVAAWFDACPKPRKRIHFWPVTRTGSNLMISTYFGSDNCAICGAKCRAQGSARAVVCDACRWIDPVRATSTALRRLQQSQQEAHAVASACSKCNGCFEDGTTFAPLKPTTTPQKARRSASSTIFGGARSLGTGIVTPIANCTCIDCPNLFERHRLREAELAANAVCKALDLF